MKLSEQLVEEYEVRINPHGVNSVILPDGKFVECTVEDCGDCVSVISDADKMTVLLPDELTKDQKSSLKYYLDEFSWGDLEILKGENSALFDTRFCDGRRNIPRVIMKIMEFYN